MEEIKPVKSHLRLVLTILWGLTLCFILGAVFFVYAISKGWLGDLPPVSDLQNPINKYASRVYSSDGELIGTWCYASENRVIVPYDSLPDNLVNALVATEDVRFYDHSGVDIKALGRAIIKRGILRQASAGGGSTITQQLAKQLYTDVAKDAGKRIMQKPLEWYIAVQLERFYTKEEIITMYFNYFDFLYNAVGIKNAAKTYFGKSTIDLSLEECATLVGMCKNPSLYNPKRFNERSRERRNVVLAQMLKAGFITKEEYEETKEKPLEVGAFHVEDHKEGPAPYFREYLRRIMMAQKPERKNYASWQGQQFHDDSVAWETNPIYGWCNKNRKKNGTNYNIYTDGLKIYTSIDTRMQKMAEDALFEHVATYLQPNFEREIKGSAIGPYRNLKLSQVNKIIDRAVRQSERYRVMKADGMSDEEIMKAFNTPITMSVFKYGTRYDNPEEVEVTMSPRDSIIYYKKFLRGAVCAIDPTNGHMLAYVPGLNFNYFQYDNIFVGHRQVGSTIKPLLYSLAIQNGWTPCDGINASPHNYGGWTPKGSALGYVSLTTALTHSNNHASVALLNELTPQSFLNYLENDLKVSTYSFGRNLTIALGSGDVSVGDMASAYTVFPGMGVHYSPLLVTRIEDSEGNVIASFSPQVNEVMSKEKAYQMITMLRSVINNGTGRALRGSGYNITADLGGKTGTTNDNADGWFIGFCPKLVVACWVGGEDRDIHFGSMAYGQGARAALPVFGKLMNKIYSKNLLGICQTDSFDIPRSFSPCVSELDGLQSAKSMIDVEEDEPEAFDF